MKKIGSIDLLKFKDLDKYNAVREFIDNIDISNDDNLPLAGEIVFVKDNIDCAGFHTTAGCVFLKDNLVTKDAPIIKNLKESGAIIVGKTNMTEFANYMTDDLPNGYSSAGGQVIHALNPKLDPLGSSSGSGAVVASKMCEMAVGTDTQYSILMVAEANGIYGFKPAHGNLSSDGIVPISKTIDSAGSLANNFTNSIRLYYALKGVKQYRLTKANPKDIKLAINISRCEDVSSGQREFFERFKQKAESLGVKFSQIVQPSNKNISIIMKREFVPHLEEYLKTSNSKVKTMDELLNLYETHKEACPYGVSILKSANEVKYTLDSKIYLDALEDRKNTINKINEELKDYDAVVMLGYTNILHYCGLASATLASSILNKNGIRRTIMIYGVNEERLISAALTLEEILNNL